MRENLAGYGCVTSLLFVGGMIALGVWMADSFSGFDATRLSANGAVTVSSR